MTIKIDQSQLLGFRLAGGTDDGLKMGGKVGGKPINLGAKTGAKPVTLGAKVGSKNG